MFLPRKGNMFSQQVQLPAAFCTRASYTPLTGGDSNAMPVAATKCIVFTGIQALCKGGEGVTCILAVAARNMQLHRVVSSEL